MTIYRYGVYKYIVTINRIGFFTVRSKTICSDKFEPISNFTILYRLNIHLNYIDISLYGKTADSESCKRALNKRARIIRARITIFFLSL